MFFLPPWDAVIFHPVAKFKLLFRTNVILLELIFHPRYGRAGRQKHDTVPEDIFAIHIIQLRSVKLATLFCESRKKSVFLFHGSEKTFFSVIYFYFLFFFPNIYLYPSMLRQIIRVHMISQEKLI